MNTAIKAGLILAVAVTLVSAVMIGAGLHENFIVSSVVSLVIYIGLNIAILFWALSKTASDCGYGKQLLNSLIIGLVGGFVIFLGSYLLLGVVFPDSIDRMREGAIVFLENANLPEEQMNAQVAKLDAATPVSQSLTGLWGTLGTSLIVGAIISIFKRKK